MNLSVGSTAPEFSAPDQAGQTHRLSQYLGSWVLVYFYPKDDTPGCTKEACGIRDNWQSFQQAGIVVLGVSADSESSHQKFAKKYDLPFALLSDPQKSIIKDYDSLVTKKMFGKEFLGIARNSFLMILKERLPKSIKKLNP